MVIAVTFDNGNIGQHFGKSEFFKIYNVEGKNILSQKVIDTDGNGHGALAGYLKEHNVEILICGGLGGGARNALAEAGIKIYPGAMGDADGQVKAFLEGNLEYNADTTCKDHDHDEGHSCGSHKEGHSCGYHHE